MVLTSRFWQPDEKASVRVAPLFVLPFSPPSNYVCMAFLGPLLRPVDEFGTEEVRSKDSAVVFL